MKLDGVITLMCANRRLASEYVAEFQKGDPAFDLYRVTHIPERQQLPERVSAFLLDESVVNTQSKRALRTVVERFVNLAPVIVVAPATRQSELARLLTAGLADFVARTGNFVPLAVGLVERRIRSEGRAIQPSPDGENGWSDFGEMLRHELNNPLTGILGNAEMVLARRDQLPSSVIERLETIANLAVRLRETVRRLSSAPQARQAG
jgi:signal transduction histidine kinase